MLCSLTLGPSTCNPLKNERKEGIPEWRLLEMKSAEPVPSLAQAITVTSKSPIAEG
jgi:hypothetical protein